MSPRRRQGLAVADAIAERPGLSAVAAWCFPTHGIRHGTVLDEDPGPSPTGQSRRRKRLSPSVPRRPQPQPCVLVTVHASFDGAVNLSAQRNPMKTPSARIYVIESLRHLAELKVGDQSWWCLEKGAEVGELGAVYVKSKGFKLAFEFLGWSDSAQMLCSNYGLKAGDIRVLTVSTDFIPANKLREHVILRSLPALRRSFQRKSFRLEDPFLKPLLDILSGSSSVENKALSTSVVSDSTRKRTLSVREDD